METIKYNLDKLGEFIEVVLNAISLLCIVAGVILSLIQSINERKRTGRIHPMHTFFRRTFGGWLVVALEFQLAADIVGTIVSPSNAHLIELGAIAVIRTFLNYFLGRELREENEMLEERSRKNKKTELNAVID